jgi:hypothetical protein
LPLTIIVRTLWKEELATETLGIPGGGSEDADCDRILMGHGRVRLIRMVDMNERRADLIVI